MTEQEKESAGDRQRENSSPSSDPPKEEYKLGAKGQPKSQLEWKYHAHDMLLNAQVSYRNTVKYGSGYERMYVGVHRQSKEEQQASVDRLSKFDPEKVPGSKARYGPRYEKMGVVGTFQANSNGKAKDGFQA